MNPPQDTPGLPPVKTLLAALVWLASRQRTQPDIKNLHAMVHQIQRLAVHPEADTHDMRAGLRLAASAEIDVTHWMGVCLDHETRLEH
jgi:hypothetical protein